MPLFTKKAIRYLIALFFIFSLNFFLPRAMPGDPVINLLGEDFFAEKETLEKIRADLGLDKPVVIQYAEYWKNLLHFDLGYSYHFRSRVSSLISSRLKWTFFLIGPSFVLGTLLGAYAGSLAGWKRESKGSTLSFFFFLFIYCSPPFFISLLLLYFFGFRLPIFPLKGFYTSGHWIDVLRHLFLPILIMTLFSASRNYMVMRGSVLQEKEKLYVWYARAKGRLGNSLLFQHVFKNASLPIVTLFALDFGFIFAGAFFVEVVFSLNGITAPNEKMKIYFEKEPSFYAGDSGEFTLVFDNTSNSILKNVNIYVKDEYFEFVKNKFMG